IRRLLAKIRHLQAASEAGSSGTLSSETLVARENFDAMRREWTAMCRHWSQRVRTLQQDRVDGEDFLRQGRRDAESRHQARIAELTDQVAQLQTQLRDSEAACQAAERRAEERVLDVNALVGFLMGNKPKINVMFNWMRLSGSSSSRRPSVLDLSPPTRNKRASTSGSRAGNRKRKASGARDVPMAKRLSLSSVRDSGHQLDRRLRPRSYSSTDMLVYSPRNVPNARDLADAGRALPDGMLWTDVREDVQHILLSGMDFKCAMKCVSESQGIHHLVPREAVCQMLTQVIHAGPRGIQAEGTLRRRQATREPTPPWHPYGRCFIKVQKRKRSTQETEALQAKLPESSNDEAQDPSYKLSRAELDKAARAEAAADNDESSEEPDGAETESKPAARHLSPAGLRESKTQKTSDKGSGSKGHVSSEGLRRIRSKLAKLNYDDLRSEHLDMVEAACRETHVSYRIFGILAKSDSYRQSQGYPDFEPHKPDIHILKARWDLEAYQALYISAPWSVMFHYRVTVFYFHEVRDLNSETLDGVKDYVDFMHVNAKPWWAILHWLTISFLGRDAADADASRDLYEERRRDVKRLRAQDEALLKRLFAIPGFPKTLLYEPGLWTLPVCACHWILKDPERSLLIRRGVADYSAQLDDLDAEDPVRTQWAAAHSDNDILATVPTFMHPLIMQPERRARNVIPLSVASRA
ncbi:hypothetical protein PHMEG_00029400, partial [Phytophthora megakarya]